MGRAEAGAGSSVSPAKAHMHLTMFQTFCCRIKQQHCLSFALICKTDALVSPPLQISSLMVGALCGLKGKQSLFVSGLLCAEVSDNFLTLNAFRHSGTDAALSLTSVTAQ